MALVMYGLPEEDFINNILNRIQCVTTIKTFCHFLSIRFFVVADVAVLLLLLLLL